MYSAEVVFIGAMIWGIASSWSAWTLGVKQGAYMMYLGYSGELGRLKWKRHRLEILIWEVERSAK